MKKLALIFGLLAMLIATPAIAADIEITITIPEAQVDRLSAMIVADLNCGELGAKACLKQELVRHIKYLLKTYEAGLIIKQSQDDINAIVDPTIQ